jgi:hypothetical protein
MQYICFSAFFGENSSLRDGIAEIFWFYLQNLPTVALLLPRAGLSLALLLTFPSVSPDYVANLEADFNRRDGTYFSASDGTLTAYACGVSLCYSQLVGNDRLIYIYWFLLIFLTRTGLFCGFLATMAVPDSVGRASDERKKIRKILCPTTTATVPLKRMLSRGVGESVCVYVSKKPMIFA